MSFAQATLLPLACAQCDAEKTNLHSDVKREKQPRIACEVPTFDFGTRDSSEIVEHIFELKNTGDSDLVITAIRPACGCTAAELTNSTIPPGESAKLSTKLTLAGRFGEIHKTILIESNDPANPALQLAMQGKIVTEVAIVPPVLILRQSATGQLASGAVQITANGKPFRITQAESSDPLVKVRTEALPDGVSHKISASLEKIPESDPQPFLIMLQTNNPRMPTIDIPATVALAREFLIVPSKIVLKAGSEPIKRTVIIKPATPRYFAISNIEVPSTGIVANAKKMGDFGYRIDLSNIVPSQELNGKELHIQIADGPLLEIPLEVATED